LLGNVQVPLCNPHTVLHSDMQSTAQSLLPSLLSVKMLLSVVLTETKRSTQQQVYEHLQQSDTVQRAPASSGSCYLTALTSHNFTDVTVPSTQLSWADCSDMSELNNRKCKCNCTVQFIVATLRTITIVISKSQSCVRQCQQSVAVGLADTASTFQHAPQIDIESPRYQDTMFERTTLWSPAEEQDVELGARKPE